MKATIRISGDYKSGHSTEGYIEIEQSFGRVYVRLDATGKVKEHSMRAAEARVVAAAFLQAADLAEQAKDSDRSHMP